MATITSIGVGSGLDANSIINALLSVERKPIELLQTEAKRYRAVVAKSKNSCFISVPTPR